MREECFSQFLAIELPLIPQSLHLYQEWLYSALGLSYIIAFNALCAQNIDDDNSIRRVCQHGQYNYVACMCWGYFWHLKRQQKMVSTTGCFIVPPQCGSITLSYHMEAIVVWMLPCTASLVRMQWSLSWQLCSSFLPTSHFKHTPTLHLHFTHTLPTLCAFTPFTHLALSCICMHCCAAALQIRLVGGGSNPFRGRVEYFLHGIWATVCDDYFGTADGNVVCNQLGYGNATGTPKFGPGSGSIAFDDLDCSGNEISLLFCPHLGNFQHNCGHSEDVGVTCEGKYACFGVLYVFVL